MARVHAMHAMQRILLARRMLRALRRLLSHQKQFLGFLKVVRHSLRGSSGVRQQILYYSWREWALQRAQKSAENDERLHFAQIRRRAATIKRTLQMWRETAM
eukprot:SAG31_NODE_23804_length_495_cov_0.916667_1_plen_101_part_01